MAPTHVQPPPRPFASWRRLGALAVSLALVAAAVSQVGVGPAAAQTCATSTDIEQAETRADQLFAARINQVRSSRGLRTLVVNPTIAAGADQWSVVMARENVLRHDPNVFTLLDSIVSSLLGTGENVGYASFVFCSATQLTSAVGSTVDYLHSLFVASPGHLRNIVDPAFNQMGIGTEISGSRMWVTVRFANGVVPVVASAASRSYVDAAYRLFLGRGASAAEIERWGPVVQTGNRAALTGALAVSNEWAGVEIRNLYRKILGRSPDSTGFAYWLGQVRAGHTIETMAAYFYGGTEYFLRAGSTNRGFVDRLYRDLLGRAPDQGGLTYWTSILNSGRLTRPAVAKEFYAGIESRTQRVTRLYRVILGRNPDVSGLAYWTDKLRTLGDIQLATYLAASEEFFRRST